MRRYYLTLVLINIGITALHLYSGDYIAAMAQFGVAAFCFWWAVRVIPRLEKRDWRP